MTDIIEKGTVYWITGLSGSGKTTIGKMLYERLKSNKPNVVFLDGDTLRSIFGNNTGYSSDERRMLALCYSRLCEMLSKQGINVICATMSLFKEVHEFNRKNIENYFEIFIECNIEELIKRDQKGIYSKATKGEFDNVIGINMPYDRPEGCDLIIDNSSKDNLVGKVEQIIHLIKESKTDRT